MRRCSALFFLFTFLAFAQAPTVENAKAPVRVDPGTVVATINGEPYTAAAVEDIVASFPAAQRTNFQRQPLPFLQQWALMQKILKHAEQEKVGERSPYREQLADLERQYQLSRKQLLYTALLTEKGYEAKVSEEERRAHYEKNKDKYREAQVKVIYLPFSASPSAGASSMNEEQARKTAEDIVAKARAGVDFVELVKKYSEDPTASKGGDLGVPVAPNTDKVPAEARTAILNAKAGEVTNPVKHSGAFYIYRVESAGPRPFDKVKDDIYTEIQNRKVVEWIESLQATSAVKVENEAYFKR